MVGNWEIFRLSTLLIFVKKNIDTGDTLKVTIRTHEIKILIKIQFLIHLCIYFSTHQALMEYLA